MDDLNVAMERAFAEPFEPLSRARRPRWPWIMPVVPFLLIGLFLLLAAVIAPGAGAAGGCGGG